jgi:phosphoribosylamine--glycine ligase
MEDRIHGSASAAVVIEEFLEGEEVSFFAICDGTEALAFGAAQDHKRVGEGDTGPNTGGMGAYSPPPAFTDALRDEVMTRFIRPTLTEMARRGMPFRGVLFAGLMLTASGPKLIEYNVRFGDPECETLLPLLRSDLLPVLHAAATGSLSGMALEWDPAHSLVVILAAEGYPGTPRHGTAILGLEAAAATPGVLVFHAGTTRDEAGTIRAAGGRVLAVQAQGASLFAAKRAAYAAVDLIDWPEGFARRDIGWRALG